MEFEKEELLRLAEFTLLREFKDDLNALTLFGQILEERRFQLRDNIIDEKQSSEEMYFLMNGKVSINKKTDGGKIIPLANLDAKDRPFFGEAAILGLSIRSANVTANSSCTCLVLKKSDFDLFAKDEPAMALSFFRNLAIGLFHRMQKADNDLFILGTNGK